MSPAPTDDIFRLARPSDIDAISSFTQMAGTGLTTVPRSADEIAYIIDQSERYLAGARDANRLLFVAQSNGQAVGISSLIPKLGLERPFYSFKRSRHARRSTTPKLSVKYDTLQLTTDFDGYTELASLYIGQAARGRGLGRLLSYGRLAFINAHPDLFETRLMADIRGWSDERGVSPFWEHLTSKFIPTEFELADQTSSVDGRFIIELLPSLPILLNTLPCEVSRCAGRPHEQSIAALRMLEAVGFAATDLCDVFDGGPSIECHARDTLIARTGLQARGAAKSDMMQDKALMQYSGTGTSFAAMIGAGNIAEGLGSKGVSQNLGVAANEIWLARISLDAAAKTRSQL